MGILNVDLNNFNFDDANFDGDDRENLENNACGMASKKIVGLAYAKRWEKINRINF